METTDLPVQEIANLKLQDRQNVRAYGPTCIGCQATKSDLMLSFGGTFEQHLLILNGNNKPAAVAPKLRILDIFITLKQAENLYLELGRILSDVNSTEISEMKSQTYEHPTGYGWTEFHLDPVVALRVKELRLGLNGCKVHSWRALAAKVTGQDVQMTGQELVKLAQLTLDENWEE